MGIRFPHKPPSTKVWVILRIYDKHCTYCKPTDDSGALVLPAGVSSDWVPPLVLVDIDVLDVSLGVNVVGAAGQTLEETSSIASGVDPGCVVVADSPHDSGVVTLHQSEVTSNLSPVPERQVKYYKHTVIQRLRGHIFLHLVTWCRVRCGLQSRRGFTDKDVSFTGDGPDGLFGGRSLDSPGVAAGHTEQGQLEEGGEKGRQGERIRGR